MDLQSQLRLSNSRLARQARCLVTVRAQSRRLMMGLSPAKKFSRLPDSGRPAIYQLRLNARRSQLSSPKRRSPQQVAGDASGVEIETRRNQQRIQKTLTGQCCPVSVFGFERWFRRVERCCILRTLPSIGLGARVWIRLRRSQLLPSRVLQSRQVEPVRWQIRRELEYQVP